jgi:hypothetical protein
VKLPGQALDLVLAPERDHACRLPEDILSALIVPCMTLRREVSMKQAATHHGPLAKHSF